MTTQIPVLDKGYVELIETWGSDQRIIEAARMSTNKGFLGWGDDEKPGDEKLLRFLWENKHATPFEMAGATFEIKAPIFVFREWHRHRTQSYNEMSARYTPLPDENYVPSLERMLMVNGESSNKQATGTGDELTPEVATQWLNTLKATYALSQSLYEQGIKIGVAKELARLPVPVARYSRMRASANLRNWLAFLSLRMAPNAQWEIRQYADTVFDLLFIHFERTLKLFIEGFKNAK